MSQSQTTAVASLHFQAIFNAAVTSFQKQTKSDLITHPLASQLQSCDSTSAILAILQDQVREFDKSRSGDERLTKWLSPTVNVITAFSATVAGGVGLVSLDRWSSKLLLIVRRYFLLRTWFLRVLASSFRHVSYLFLWADRSHDKVLLGGQWCCSE